MYDSAPMKKLSLPTTSLTQAVDQLPALKQDLFHREYQSKQKSTSTSFILWFSGLHYLYYNKWFLQIIFLLTFGGLGVWWIIDLFKIKKRVNDWNHSVAVDLLNRV